MKIASISVIGLGKLGGPFLAAIASRGFRVIGVDVSSKTVEKINAAKTPVYEPKLALFLKKYRNNIQATTEYQEAINNSEISFIVVPTPSKRDGSFSNKFVKQVVANIGGALRNKKKNKHSLFSHNHLGGVASQHLRGGRMDSSEVSPGQVKKDCHVVAIVSTISPGSMEGDIVPILERYSGKKVGESIGLCYNPSFIALGNVIDGLLSPDFVLIGESDKRAGSVLENFYKKFCKNKPPIARMNLIDAEITKIALNTFITTKISFANMLASLCQQVKGADVDTITEALGLDSRIGAKYLKGAVAYGGPCFPRDNRALTAFGKKVGVSLPLPKVTDRINHAQTKEIADLVFTQVKKGATIGILGLSYKPYTVVIEESQGLLLAKYLKNRGYLVITYDPVSKRGTIPGGVEAFSSKSIEDVVAESDALVITTSWPEFASKLPDLLTKVSKKKIIIDCWRMLNPNDLPNEIIYIGRGRGR